MSIIRGILERARLDSMIAGLLDEPEPAMGNIEVSENFIEDSYKEFIAKLVKLYPDINKDDDELFDAVIKFAAVHEETFFKIGVIVGTKWEKELKEGEESIKNMGIHK